jgi:ribonuclease HI
MYPRELWIYTDGSGINGEVGASAWCEQKDWQARIYLGPDTDYTVYSAELMGISSALGMALQAGRRYNKVIVFTDNQAAILSTQRPRLQFGQYILQRTTYLIDRLRNVNTTVKVRWIPAHMGVAGNEKADSLAKKAAGHKSPRGSMVGTAIKLKAACKRTIRAACLSQWQENFPRGTTGVLYRKFFGNSLDCHIERVYSNGELPKALSSILIQIRTGKIGLRSYLFKIKRAKDPHCECKRSNQTVLHLIEDCPLYQQQRKAHLGRPFLVNARWTLSDPRTAVKAATFMLSTGLLDQFRYYKKELYKQIEHGVDE